MEETFLVLSLLASGVPTLLLAAASYVLTAMALYTIAQRRQIEKPWLAWVPVVNSWILGSISDQYQYLVKGQNKSKRKLLLVLKILSAVLGTICAILGTIVGTALLVGYGNQDMVVGVLGFAMPVIGLCVPMLVAIIIAAAVIRYMALYDIYRSLDPDNSILFLVLSILAGILEPFFLFFSRNRDTGMPPRKQPETIHAEEGHRETWVTE